jgi:hypothetical protein
VSNIGSSVSPNTDLERFVYASVATEPNGMELSVLSALSRRGLDPWREAQRLAELPPSGAADGLAQILRAVPAVQALRLDVKVIAERLVALLPVQGTGTGGGSLSQRAAAQVQVPRELTLVMMAVIFGGLLMPLLMPKQAEPVAPASWITEAHQPPVKAQAVAGESGTSALAAHPTAAAATTPPH